MKLTQDRLGDPIMTDAIGPAGSSQPSFDMSSQTLDSVKADLQDLKDLLRQLQKSQDSDTTDQLKSELKDILKKLKDDVKGLMHQGHPAAQQLQSLLTKPIDPNDSDTSLISPTGQIANSSSMDSIKDFLSSDDGQSKLQEIQGKIKNFMKQH